MDNVGILGNTVVKKLAERLPPGWRIVKTTRSARQPQSVIKILRRVEEAVPFWSNEAPLEPKDVEFLTASGQNARNRPVLIIAPFMSPRTRERLSAGGFGYGDLTGNLRLCISEPGLFIETCGAERDPFRESRKWKSLKGAKAGRLIRTLCDFHAPMGIRQLAKVAGIDAGYVSRLVDFLRGQALISREGRGPIVSSDWAGLLREWSKQYSPFERVTWYLAPRGIPQTVERLKGLSQRYATSGSWAAAQFAPVSPTRLLLCYADDPEEMARALDLRQADAGANVALAAPFDSVVYERTTLLKGVRVTAPSQIAADLLASPGRGPNEAEALMRWMLENEDAWRN